MKRALWLAGCCVLLGTAAVASHADGTPAKHVKDPAAVNPTTGAAITGSSDAMHTPVPVPSGNVGVVPSPTTPPDLTASIDFSNPIDLSSTDPEEIARATLQKSHDNQLENQGNLEAEEMRERQEAAAQHDWMLRDYQDRMRKSGLMKASPDDATPDGIEAVRAPDSSTPNFADDPLLPQNAEPEPKPKTTAAAPDDTLDADKKNLTDSLLGSISLPPLLPPLNSPENTSSPTHDYFGGSDSTNPLAANAPIPTPPPGAAPRDPDSLLDVPGLTAAQQVGMPPDDANSALDDRLPDGPASDMSQPHPNQNDFMLPTVPTNDIDSFYKKQAESLAPPTAPTVQAPPTLTLPKTYEPPPITAKPVVDGLRNHVADPFDFLNR